MRPRKQLIPLSLDALTTALPPGRAYTINALHLMVEGTPDELSALLRQAVEAGRVCASIEIRGFRRTYWIPAATAPGVAERRWQPADMRGSLNGYDLMSLARLALAARR